MLMSATNRLAPVVNEARDMLAADRAIGVDEATSRLLSQTRVANQAARIISVVTIAVTALIGTLIMGEIYGAIDFSGAAFESGGALENVPDDLLGGFGSAISFVPIILIVLLAALVIGVVSRMG